MESLRYSTFGSYDHVDADCGEVSFPLSIVDNSCPVCSGQFLDVSRSPSDRQILGLSLCVGCGWWHLHEDILLELDGNPGPKPARAWELHHAALDRIDLTSNDLPIETLRNHLARYWDQRVDISAQQAEDLVGSILTEHHGGEIVKLTANANAPDGGVDLIVVHEGGDIRRAVQVKRRLKRDVEGVQEVRNFVGAMLLRGERRGTFVTTASQFSKPARALPGNPNLVHARLSLELIDGERLHEMLERPALAGDLSLPSTMSLDGDWTTSGGGELTCRELLLGDLRKLRPLARPPGARMGWNTTYARPQEDFLRDFQPISGNP